MLHTFIMATQDAATFNLSIRRACDDDLDDLVAMVEDFVRGNRAEPFPRSRDKLRAAYLSDDPVGRMFVAVKHGRVVGMAQWLRMFDMFWSSFGARVDWLYVRPDARALGIAAALIAEICDDVRRCGGEFIWGSGDDTASRLYQKVANSWPTRECAVAGEAFQVFADLAGRSPRDIIRGLPAPELNRVDPLPRQR
jgi:GNAT superfamily N-acetyltransferase